MSIVYVIQEIAGTKAGRPKINILGAQKYGTIKVLLKEDSQMIFSPGPIIFQLTKLLKNFQPTLLYTLIFVLIGDMVYSSISPFSYKFIFIG